MKGEKTMSEAMEIYCVKCGCIESADEMVYVASEDAYYCKECAESEGFRECEHCGEWHRDDDLRVVYVSNGEELWCESCRERDAFECEHCGDFYCKDDYETRTVNSDGYDEEWCEDCVRDYAFECYECGELIDEQYAVYIDSGGYHVCQNCRDNLYSACYDCGEYFITENLNVSCGRSICDSCAEWNDLWHWCEECGSWVYEDAWDYEAECCRNCVGATRRSDNARVRSYHGDEPFMQYFGKYEGAFKGLGIELEIDRSSPNSFSRQNCLNQLDELFGDAAYFKYDGSLNYGIEIVTLPHTLEAFYELPWEKVLLACQSNGYSSHDIGTCGLHVHISRTLFGEDEEVQSDNIAKLMQFYNIYWDDIIRVSRRTTEQAVQWANKYPTVRKDTLKGWATKSGKYYRRYMAVNVTNDDTVEIRINRGTLNLGTFLSTIDFVMTTAKNSTKIGWADISDDYLWLNGLKKETLDYIQSRSAFCDAVDKYLSDYWREEMERNNGRSRQTVEFRNVEFRNTVELRNDDSDFLTELMEAFNATEGYAF